MEGNKDEEEEEEEENADLDEVKIMIGKRKKGNC